MSINSSKNQWDDEPTVEEKSRNPFGLKTEKIKKSGELRVIDSNKISIPPGACSISGSNLTRTERAAHTVDADAGCNRAVRARREENRAPGATFP